MLYIINTFFFIQLDSDTIKQGLQCNNGPKLISLEEAQQRVHKQRELTKSFSLDSGKSSILYFKIKF